MGTTPASAREALDMVRAGLGYLAAVDAAQLGTAAQAECLRELERAEAVLTAARAFILAGFTAGQGYSGDADYSPRAWLIHKTRVSKGAAVAHTAWARRATTHPRVVAALATGELSESYGRTICQWTDKLPEDCREAADAILLSAAQAGMDLRDLAGLAAEIYERSRSELPDEDPARAFEDRGGAAGDHLRRRGRDDRGPDPGVRRGRRRRCWTRCPPRPGPRMTGPGSSGTTTRCRRRCAAWSPRACCRSGPGSRSRSGRTSRWPTCSGWTAARPCRRSGPRRSAPSGPRTAPSLRGRRERRRVAGRGRRRGASRATRPWPRSSPAT